MVRAAANHPEDTMTKTCSSRSNAKRAAVAELGTDAMEGTDYRLIKTANRWSWTTEQQPAPEPAVDEAPAAAVEEDVAAAEAGFSKPRQRADSKQAQLITMLKRPQGASIDEIAATFKWRSHTVRGAIAGALKKKMGLTVISEKVEGRRLYRIPE